MTGGEGTGIGGRGFCLVARDDEMMAGGRSGSLSLSTVTGFRLDLEIVNDQIIARWESSTYLE